MPKPDKYLCSKKHLSGTEKFTAASGGIGLPVETFYNMRIAHLLDFQQISDFTLGCHEG